MSFFRKTFAPLFAIAALFCIAACSDGNDTPFTPYEAPKQQKTYCAASSNFSDYTKSVMKSLPYAKAGAKSVPDLFVVSGADLASLTGDGLKKFFETSLKGGTVLVDSPTPAQIASFKANADALFATADGENLKGRVAHRANTFYEVAKQVDAYLGETVPLVTPLSGERIEAYEAIAVREKQIYYVHKIDALLNRGTDRHESSVSRPDTERPCEETALTNNPALTPETDWENAQKSSVSSFSSWLDGKGSSLLASRSADISAVKGLSASQIAALQEDPMQAQTFVHNFTATFQHSTDSQYHYDGRYNGKAENVEVVIDVWAACAIADDLHSANNTDWYLVRTSVVCNNQQLGYKNDWDSSKHVGPYFDYCTIATQMEDSKIRVTDSSPQNAAGSSTFTTGSSFSLSGNVGFCPTGPTGGVGVGYSESQSTSRSIPDIKVTFDGTGASDPSSTSWNYTTPTVEPGWSWFETYCDGPKEIQTVAAIFDTYTLYTLGSNWSHSDDKEYARLETDVGVRLTSIAGWLETFYDLHWYWLYTDSTVSYTDYIKKPCDVFAEYIMSFKPPEGVTPEQADRLHGIVKEYISDWNSVERYYGVAKDPSAPYDSLSEVAKNYFASVKKKITDNKGVFKDRGFKGTFTFYVNRVDGGGLIDSFDLTF